MRGKRDVRGPSPEEASGSNVAGRHEEVEANKQPRRRERVQQHAPLALGPRRARKAGIQKGQIGPDHCRVLHGPLASRVF